MGYFFYAQKKGNNYNGLIINTVFQVTSKPQMVTVSISKKNLTHDYIWKSRVFTASILSQTRHL
ncbi:MAG: flavin reductase [Candidatus Heimdallarchaeota archaeon]